MRTINADELLAELNSRRMLYREYMRGPSDDITWGSDHRCRDLCEHLINHINQQLEQPSDQPIWTQQAYASLGFKRDSMTPTEIEAVQKFLGPLEQPEQEKEDEK